MYAINCLPSKRVLSKRIGEIKSKTLYPDSALTRLAGFRSKRLFLSLSVQMIRPTQVIYAQAVPGETTKTVLASVGQTNKQITASVYVHPSYGGSKYTVLQGYTGNVSISPYC